MPTPLHVIALISGGKDSFHALLHCLAQGHRVVALANLHPPGDASEQAQAAAQPKTLPADPGTEQSERASASVRSGALPAESASAPDDIESQMYQTVGHALIPLYAQALALPLFRGPISGHAVDAAREYTRPAAHPAVLSPASPAALPDETEALVPLLRRVRAAHPEANALCSGAILSTYQRSRVEDVCARLALVSLAWLWEYPALPAPTPSPGSLLDDAAAAGLDARIVKVASGGLDERFLWASLADPKVRAGLQRAVARFGGSVLGEGGEFETLVVAGPKPLWRGMLEVDDEDKVVVSLEGGEALLRIKKARVVPNQKKQGAEQDWSERVKIPELFDSSFRDVLSQLEKADWTHSTSPRLPSPKRTGQRWTLRQAASRTSNAVYISNLTSTDGADDIRAQTSSVCTAMRKHLRTHSLSPDDIVFTTILLRSMSDFAVVNAVYSRLFTKPLPPARATVAVGDALPEGVDVSVSLVATAVHGQQKKGLHVQSRSYWAPANIGPYSQAINLPLAAEPDGEQAAAVFVAGQIPLIPATMQPLDGTFIRAAVVSAQHLWRIGLKMGVGSWTGAVAFLAGNEKDISIRAKQCAKIWQMLHKDSSGDDGESEEDADFDVWHQRHGVASSFGNMKQLKQKGLPDWDALVSDKRLGLACSGFLAVQVHELPRGSPVEWHSLGIAANLVEIASDGSGEAASRKTSVKSRNLRVHVHEIGSASGEGAAAVILEQHGLARKADVPSSQAAAHAILYTSKPETASEASVQIVPCKRIWGQDGAELLAGLVIIDL